eukprot:gene24714-10352_t
MSAAATTEQPMSINEVEEISMNDQEVRIASLAEKLNSDAGQVAASQLVQGGELESEAEMSEAPYLRRWLVGRSWNVQSACTSILNHAAWRLKMMPEGSIQEADIKNELACEKAFVLGCDKSGRTLVLLQFRKHNAWTRSLDEVERFCCYLLDKAIAACDHASNPSGQVSVILDLSGMGALNMDMSAIQALFKLLAEHYVERLGQMVMYNPPLIFWGTWKTLSPLIPEKTRNKIHVVDPQERDILIANVEAHVLPVEYGGVAEMVGPVSQVACLV